VKHFDFENIEPFYFQLYLNEEFVGVKTADVSTKDEVLIADWNVGDLLGDLLFNRVKLYAGNVFIEETFFKDGPYFIGKNIGGKLKYKPDAEIIIKKTDLGKKLKKIHIEVEGKKERGK
jgi:hypothetical protein